MTDELAESEPRGHRVFFGNIAILVAIVIIVLVLQMLRGCDTAKGSTRNRDGNRSITSVDGLSPARGVVSLWLNDGLAARPVLDSAGVSAVDIVDMGGGRFVVTVPEGTEVRAIARLAATEDVVDSGLVYADEATK